MESQEVTRISGWNYRAVRHKEYCAIHEVYYDPYGKICGWTGPVEAIADDLDDLAEDLRRMLAALEEPALRSEDMPGQNRGANV